MRAARSTGKGKGARGKFLSDQLGVLGTIRAPAFQPIVDFFFQRRPRAVRIAPTVVAQILSRGVVWCRKARNKDTALLVKVLSFRFEPDSLVLQFASPSDFERRLDRFWFSPEHGPSSFP